MRILLSSALGLLLASLAVAQTAEELQSAARGLGYPPLAKVARVEGPVLLDVNRGVVALRSGHPLLAAVAVENAKTLALILDQGEHSITYHFELTAEPTMVPRSTNVKRGDAFDRAILRVLGLKTERVVVTWECVEPPPPPANEVKVSGSSIEITIRGRVPCLMVDSATLVAKR